MTMNPIDTLLEMFLQKVPEGEKNIEIRLACRDNGATCSVALYKTSSDLYQDEAEYRALMDILFPFVEFITSSKVRDRIHENDKKQILWVRQLGNKSPDGHYEYIFLAIK